MFTLERQQKIMEHIKENKKATVTELAEKYFNSEATIRRDLDALQAQGVIKRTYGGAIWLEGLDSEIPLYMREGEFKHEKETIAQLAAGMVKDGDVIILDSSSTTHEMVKFLRGKKNITVLTNGAKTALSLASLHINVFSTGGKMRENSLSYIGDIAKISIKNFCANKLFFSCRAISSTYGLLDSSIEEAELRRYMMAQSQSSILLCSDDKFEKSSFYHICDINRINCLVTNSLPPEPILGQIKEYGVQIITPQYQYK